MPCGGASSSNATRDPVEARIRPPPRVRGQHGAMRRKHGHNVHGHHIQHPVKKTTVQHRISKPDQLVNMCIPCKAQLGVLAKEIRQVQIVHQRHHVRRQRKHFDSRNTCIDEDAPARARLTLSPSGCGHQVAVESSTGSKLRVHEVRATAGLVVNAINTDEYHIGPGIH
eukprot:2790760-Prymnesium_polylepis.1